MAYRSLVRHWAYALRICWAWIVVMTSARVGADIVKTHLLLDEAGQPLLGFDLTFFIGWFLFIPLASIAVAWHRLLLTGERDSSTIYLRLDGAVWRYLGFAVLLYVVSLSPVVIVRGAGEVMTLFSGFPDTGAAVGPAAPGYMLAPTAKSIISTMQAGAILVFFALSARLGAMLPGKALGSQGLSIRQTWQVTSGHTWSLMMGFIACIVPFLILTALLRRSGFDFSLDDGALLHIADWLVIETMGAVLGLIELAYLTFCFSFFFPASDKQSSGDLSDGSAA